MSYSDEFRRVVHDLAAELFGPDVAVIEPASITVTEDHAAGLSEADLVVVVPEGHATLADELALTDAVEMSQPGMQPVLRLVSRHMLGSAVPGSEQVS